MLFIGRNEINLVRAQERRHVNVGQPAMQNPAVNQDKGHVEPTAQNEADNDPVPQNVPEPPPGPAKPRPVERRDAIAADLSDPEDEPPRQRRRLSDLIRENNERVNTFMTRTVPRLNVHTYIHPTFSIHTEHPYVLHTLTAFTHHIHRMSSNVTGRPLTIS